MNLAKYLPATVSLCALLGLVITAEGCGGNVICDSCECDPDACTAGTTTETGTGPETSTGTETGTVTGTSTGIPTSPGKVCEIVCDCFGCTEDDFQSCLASFGEGLESAQQAGCEKEYLAAYACYEDNLQCIGGELYYEECEPLIDAFNACMEGPPPDPTECDPYVNQIVEKFNACGIDIEVPQPFDCTAETLSQLACFTPCVQQATCGAFDGTGTDAEIEAYIKCTETCQ